MTDLRSAAQQALEALNSLATAQLADGTYADKDCKITFAITALKAALAEPVPPPEAQTEAEKMAYCAGWWDALAKARKAEPVEEPQGCDHCNHPLYAATKCRVCGRVTEPVQEPVAYSVGRTLHWHEGKGVNDAQLYTAPPQRPAEPVPQEPAAIVGTQEDVWKGQGGQWAPPGPPIKTVHMLRELPVGELLYTAPPQRKPLSEDEIFKIENDIPDDVIGDRAWTICFARAVERAHGIGGEG